MAIRTIRVGIDAAPPAPMQLGNPELDFGLVFAGLGSRIVDELMAREIDLACNAATITKDRQRKVNICDSSSSAGRLR
jgi:hypothetical protein